MTNQVIRLYVSLLIGLASVAHATSETPKLPYDPNTAADCTWWIENDGSKKCEDIPQFWDIDIIDWIMWNPSLTNDCENFLPGRSYCVEATSVFPPGLWSASSGRQKVNAAVSSCQHQDGLVKDCITYHKVRASDTCQNIVDKYRTLTVAEFHRWNPAIGLKCSSLFINYLVCVDAPGTDPKPPETSAHSPTQPGISKSCDKYYKADRGDTCQGIVDKYPHLTSSDFRKWNPAIKDDCVGLWQGYYYCVGITPAFELKAHYSAGCKGKLHGQRTVASGTDGGCFDTNCQVASFDISTVGDCPGGQVQISYWEQPGCTGKWFGYGYTSRDTCRTLWTDGWKFKSVWLRCAREVDDCVNKGTCTYDPEPSHGVCM
ncbi:LysM domain-containing protein [Metarhizium rileyi]|uniref:LysM domain-containing protein n=1 Tax=Metarhizium rileyi (strain RCEF 4871) TaxID=1649241 RepID=A0A167DC85_METRR|nr:LysM domain-containing protein [Metarhizium rileyi RCEF 4871]